MTDAEPLAILLLSGAYERVHYGFVLAAGAAAVGAPVLVFATNGGLHGLCRDWSGLEGADADTTARTRGVAGFDELRAAALGFGARLVACEAGLRLRAIEAGALMPEVSVGGVTGFLAEARGRIVSL